MKITTYPISAKMRWQLVKDGWISRHPMTFIDDKVILADFLAQSVKALKKDPHFNVRALIHTTFSKCRRYYLTDTHRRLFGQERKIDNPYEMDITELFVSTLEAQIKAYDTDVNHLDKTLLTKIEATEEYKAALLQLNVWGYSAI